MYIADFIQVTRELYFSENFPKKKDELPQNYWTRYILLKTRWGAISYWHQLIDLMNSYRYFIIAAGKRKPYSPAFADSQISYLLSVVS